MSNVNIKRAVDMIRASTTVYTPVIEVIVNAIQAVDASSRIDGRIDVAVIRSSQVELDGSLPPVTSITVSDNGIGFNQEQRDSFDTLYTDLKLADGGKGFGRFIVLKYFDDLHVDSTFATQNGYKKRRFSMGKANEIIVNEVIEPIERGEPGTRVTLAKLKAGQSFDKKLSTIARQVAEKLLPYFLTEGYTCPRITIREEVGDDAICLNDLFNNSLSADIREVPNAAARFTLPSTNGDEEFSVRVFKLFAPRQAVSRISLVAHKREVTGSALHRWVPEFEEEFYERTSGTGGHGRNYLIRAYVFSEYLDRTVSLERGGFEFQAENDLVYGISQAQIEEKAAAAARNAEIGELTSRQERKKAIVQGYVDEQAPWHKELLAKIDLSDFPMRPTEEDIEARLQKEKFREEQSIRQDVSRLLESTNLSTLRESVGAVVERIAGNSKNDLVHYIALRRTLLDLFGKSLETNTEGKYEAEGVVHDIVFPRKGDTERTTFHDHNLWLLDERLNFTSYVSSDVPLTGGRSERPDLLVYGRRVAFRGDNDPSNPVTIFEFKKPQRDDFVNAASTEDPVQQVVRYVNDIRDGKYKTPEGRQMRIGDGTPFYGYVVCDLTPKVVQWLQREKDFKPMPDRQGWFQWMGNINLYVEVISWDKVLRDARMRNAVFFKKLGI